MTEVGRGCWTRVGGTTPWYTKTPDGVPDVGEVWWRYINQGKAPTPVNGGVKAYQAVFAGVKATQTLLGVKADGWWGDLTQAALVAFQQRKGLLGTDGKPDGLAGPRTVAAMLTDSVRLAATSIGMPFYALNGLFNWESGYDPGGMGVNNWDTGVAQINLDPVNGHGDTVTWDQAMDPLWSLHWTVNALKGQTTKLKPYCDASGALLLHCVIASHNSPKLALDWAKTGTPPYVEGRVIQIDTYVAMVLASG